MLHWVSRVFLAVQSTLLILIPVSDDLWRLEKLT